jgi:hypothetical protein
MGDEVGQYDSDWYKNKDKGDSYAKVVSRM